MNKVQEIFVYALCGDNIHIETLNLSLKYLKKFTNNKIFIVSDLRRNKIKINHTEVLDVETPKELNNHQASIFLKTSLHKLLPKGNLYCYIDTDVLSIHKDSSNVFREYKKPITFAQDHQSLKKFSPFAINCSCSKKVKQRKVLLDTQKKYGINEKEILIKKNKLELLLQKNKTSFFKNISTNLKFNLSKNIFELNNEFSFHKKEKVWKDKIGNVVMYDYDINKIIENETGLFYNSEKKIWINNENENILLDSCTHLISEIDKKFAIININENWQHWNGGVFLFDDDSHSFLDSWHNKTMQIFKDNNWKTRDQGTLIATTWEYKLQKHQTLSKKWNFIINYNNKGIELKENLTITDDFWKTQHKPSFIHIYNHWNDKSWNVWRVINKIL